MVWRRALQGAPVANAMDVKLISVRGNQHVDLALFQRNRSVSDKNHACAHGENHWQQTHFDSYLCQSSETASMVSDTGQSESLMRFTGVTGALKAK